ncbi:hypothetical protein N008_20890 [Hymenobacter sp. APR13]|nr:hypothetical protein N008_20890 [Hymenobacter sp. APR13]
MEVLKTAYFKRSWVLGHGQRLLDTFGYAALLALPVQLQVVGVIQAPQPLMIHQ